MRRTKNAQVPFDFCLLADHALKNAKVISSSDRERDSVEIEIQFLFEVVGLVISSNTDKLIDQKAMEILETLESIKGFDEIQISALKLVEGSSTIRIRSTLMSIVKRFQNPFKIRQLREQIRSDFRSETDSKTDLEKIRWHLDKMLCYESETVAEWKNVTSVYDDEPYPRQELLQLIDSGKWLVMEFSDEKADAMISWIKGLHLFAARNRRSFVTVAVLADFDKLRDNMSSIWLARFGEVGAIFQPFPEDAKNFTKAIIDFDAEITRIDERREERARKQ
jgi:hypothetical protein